MITRNRILTLIVSAAGVGFFYLFDWPLPFLLGPMAACLICALCSMQLQGMGWFGMLMRTFLGVAIGTAITPEIVGQLSGYALSLAMMPVLILALASAGYILFRATGFDKQTSLYASMPGGLQEMLLLGEGAGGNVRALSLIHATRVLSIFLFVPFAITLIWGIDLSVLPGIPATNLPLHEVLLMVASGIIGWQLALLLRIPGPSILGPALLAMTLSLTGLVHSRPPSEMMLAAQFFIGLAVGVRYVGITLVELRRYVLAGAIYSVITGTISVLFFLVVSSLLLLPPIDVLLAFLPGGQAEMAIIAIVSGADVPFVVAHHLVRLMLVLVFAQLVSGWIRKNW